MTRLYKYLALAGIVFFVQNSFGGAIIYDIARPIGPAGVWGTIETNGKIGALYPSDIISFSLLLDAGGYLRTRMDSSSNAIFNVRGESFLFASEHDLSFSWVGSGNGSSVSFSKNSSTSSVWLLTTQHIERHPPYELFDINSQPGSANAEVYEFYPPIGLFQQIGVRSPESPLPVSEPSSISILLAGLLLIYLGHQKSIIRSKNIEGSAQPNILGC